MFETLTDKLQAVFRRVGNRGTITEKDLDEALREVRLALLEADVHFQVVRDFVQRVRERALGAHVIGSLTPMQQIIDIVHQELITTLGGGHARLERAHQPPTVLMLVGLKGSGKTTTAAKLGLHLRRHGERPLLVAADPRRVAAAEQLLALARQLDLSAVADGALKPADLARRALGQARDLGASTVIVDSAGYLQLGPDERAELSALHQGFAPREVLLVADAMTGQEAVHAAQQFHEAVGLTGLILTKLDGDARGGAALSIRTVTGVPIKFVGVGEKADALEPFHPDRFASRILGMGDVVTLIEKAKEQVAEEDARALAERMRRGSVTLEDFLAQFQQLRRMGPLGQLAQMVPGFSALGRRVAPQDLDESFLNKAEAIIYSMTPEERRHPEIIDGSRRRRIARGSGTQPADVNLLLKQFREAKRLMQMLATGPGSRLSLLRR